MTIILALKGRKAKFGVGRWHHRMNNEYRSAHHMLVVNANEHISPHSHGTTNEYAASFPELSLCFTYYALCFRTDQQFYFEINDFYSSLDFLFRALKTGKLAQSTNKHNLSER